MAANPVCHPGVGGGSGKAIRIACLCLSPARPPGASQPRARKVGRDPGALEPPGFSLPPALHESQVSVEAVAAGCRAGRVQLGLDGGHWHGGDFPGGWGSRRLPHHHPPQLSGPKKGAEKVWLRRRRLRSPWMPVAGAGNFVPRSSWWGWWQRGPGTLATATTAPQLAPGSWHAGYCCCFGCWKLRCCLGSRCRWRGRGPGQVSSPRCHRLSSNRVGSKYNGERGISIRDHGGGRGLRRGDPHRLPSPEPLPNRQGYGALRADSSATLGAHRVGRSLSRVVFVGNALLFLLLSPPLLTPSSGESETPGPDCAGAKRLAVSSTGRTAPRGRVWGGGSERKAACWRAPGAREERAPESWLRARPPCPRWAAPAGVQAALRQAPPALGGIPSAQPSMKSDQVSKRVMITSLHPGAEGLVIRSITAAPHRVRPWRGAQEAQSAKRDWGLANGRKADLLVLPLSQQAPINIQFLLKGMWRLHCAASQDLDSQAPEWRLQQGLQSLLREIIATSLLRSCFCVCKKLRMLLPYHVICE
ncbi:PREDICTED: uncharacterized protein LOC106727122 [Myotis brandtii]|uniref:uncharacterized protein LOC106727122 n=1 Tax=Myotis brandtii TaxID=109478 RepID=UPI0007042FE6|nr:PREDICTED: uncharacterized protein LOC106727122 [Myotis brandtii]